LRTVFIGDIVGEKGRKTVKRLLGSIKEKFQPDFVIANGENAAGGFGITPEIADELFMYGIDIITSGNHIWDKKEINSYLDSYKPIIRPANYPEGVPGRGMVSLEKGGKLITVINLQGRVFMNNLIDCPFKTADKLLSSAEIPRKSPIFVDFHAEATSEKQAMIHYLSGRVAAVIGTHTHVPTADAEISNQTAFITDAGMTGSFDSVIGFRKKETINRFLYGLPQRFVTNGADKRLCGVIVDTEGKQAKSIMQLMIKNDL